MAEYIKRSDVEEWLKDICEATESGAEYVLARVDEIPSADVAEVVRCKDCSHAHETSFPSELRICLTTGCFHSENHFCSDGKRMDGGT